MVPVAIHEAWGEAPSPTWGHIDSFVFAFFGALPWSLPPPARRGGGKSPHEASESFFGLAQITCLSLGELARRYAF